MSRTSPKASTSIQDERSELPEGWSQSDVGECFYDIRNGTTEQQNKDGRGVPVSRIESIQNASFDPNRFGYIENSSPLLASFRYKQGDIALSHINSYEHVGKTALYEGNPPILLHGMNLLRLRLGHQRLLPRFLHLFMQSDRFRDDVRSKVTHAVNQVSINQKNLSTVCVLVPPYLEQVRIVNKTEQLSSNVNSSRGHLSRAILILKRFRQSVLAAACSGRLTDDWRETQPAAQGGRQFGEGEPPDDFELPDSWDWHLSADAFSFVTSGSRGWAKYYADDGAIFLRVGNLNHDSVELDLRHVQHVKPPSNAEGVRTRVRLDDILISITADVGMIALVDQDIGEAYINQHLALARPTDNFDHRYLAYFLAAQKGGWGQFQNLQRGATKVGLGLDDIRSIWIARPPIVEQREIVRRVEALFKLAEAIEERVAAATKRTEMLTQAILSKAFRGELVPTEAELARQEGRTYESAAELLERLRQDRAGAVTGAAMSRKPNRRRSISEETLQ